MIRRLALLLLVATLPLGALAAQGGGADDRLRQQRDELDKIRRERDSLQARMRDLQGRVHDLSEEVTNVHRQAEATSRLVKSLDQQIASLGTEVKAATEKVVDAEREVSSQRTKLKHRVRDIYKRGPLFATEALLAARSFGELVARYKYLHELALYDRSVVQHVEVLYKQIDAQRQLLVRLQDEFARNRQEKSREEVRLRELEDQRSRSLTQTRASQQQVQSRLQQIQRDEVRLAQLLANLEATRRRAEAASPNAPGASASTLTTADFGKLDWPVEGEILYRFGREVSPNNTAIRWNGIGIGAPLGTPVRALSAGEVMVADQIGTYGSTIIVQHGGGDYSVYGSLQRFAVAKGAKVAKGQVIGYVGQADPDMKPHLHLEIRPNGRATDPLTWMQAGKR